MSEKQEDPASPPPHKDIEVAPLADSEKQIDQEEANQLDKNAEQAANPEEENKDDEAAAADASPQK